MNIRKTYKGMLCVVGMMCLLASCSTPKNVAYMQGAQNAEIFEIAAAQTKAIKVEPFDKLSIIVSSKDPALAQM